LPPPFRGFPGKKNGLFFFCAGGGLRQSSAPAPFFHTLGFLLFPVESCLSGDEAYPLVPPRFAEARSRGVLSLFLGKKDVLVQAMPHFFSADLVLADFSVLPSLFSPGDVPLIFGSCFFFCEPREGLEQPLSPPLEPPCLFRRPRTLFCVSPPLGQEFRDRRRGAGAFFLFSLLLPPCFFFFSFSSLQRRIPPRRRSSRPLPSLSDGVVAVVRSSPLRAWVRCDGFLRAFSPSTTESGISCRDSPFVKRSEKTSFLLGGFSRARHHPSTPPF